jgi:vacuolar protein sorting-associated protein VTA1
VKAGEDPNLTSPPAESVEESKPPAEHNSPEIIVNQPAESEEQSERRRQPSVEEVPDDFDQVQHRLAQQSTLDESIHPSRSSSTAPRTRQDLPSMAAAAAPAAAPASGAASPTVFPTTLMDINSGTRQRPSYLSRAANLPDLPAAPSDFPSPASSGPGTPMHLGSPPEAFPRIGTLHSFPPPTPSALPPGISPFDTIQPHQPQPPTVPQDYSKGAHGQVPSLPPTSVSHRPPPTSVPPTTVQSRTAVGTTVDDEAIAQAQKHARWAVSALNFDDVTTAVKELRNALGLLGAS